MLELLLITIGVFSGGAGGDSDIYVWRNAKGVTGYSYSPPQLDTVEVRRVRGGATRGNRSGGEEPAERGRRIMLAWNDTGADSLPALFSDGGANAVSVQPPGFSQLPLATTLTGVGLSAQIAFVCTFARSPRACGFYEQAKAPGRASTVAFPYEGIYGVRLRTLPGDSHVYGSGSAERTDLSLSQEDTGCYEGREQVWEHSVLFPDDYVPPPRGGWGVVFDFHHTGPRGQANFHVDAMPFGLRFRGYGGDNVNDGHYEATLGPVVRNSWYHFVYHVKWSSGQDGFFNAWVNGAQRLAHRGPTLYRGMGCYLKLANYHTANGAPSSVIHARVIRRDVNR